MEFLDYLEKEIEKYESEEITRTDLLILVQPGKAPDEGGQEQVERGPQGGQEHKIELIRTSGHTLR